MIESRIDRARLAGRLRLVVTRLNRRLRHQAESGLTPTAESALATINRHGSLSLGELAAHEGIKPPSITTLIAALEQQGLVVRVPDAADRRISRVSITADGRQRLERGRSRKTAYLAARLGRLDQRRLQVLAEAADILESLLEADR